MLIQYIPFVCFDAVAFFSLLANLVHSFIEQYELRSLTNHLSFNYSTAYLHMSTMLYLTIVVPLASSVVIYPLQST